MADNVNLRALALETLLEAEKTEGKLNEIINVVLEKYAYLPKNQRAFYARLVEGTAENRIKIDYIIDCYSKVPVIKMKPAVRNILRTAIYQIKEMQSVPDSAAVNEAVKLAAKKGFTRLKGFVNGVLRSIIREPEKCVLPDRTDIKKYICVNYSMPEFIVSEWIERFGDKTAEDICRAFLNEKKTTIRIRGNEEQITETKESLIKEGVKIEKAPYVDYAYYISDFDNLSELESFKQGGFAVQDISSMIAVECAAIDAGRDLNIIDVCAAPGGKSLLAADLSSDDTKIISRDISYKKTDLIEDNILRFGVDKIAAEVWDASQFDPKYEASMDIVIADVPCSGFGVIGHKPDIKYNASEDKVRSLVNIQRSIIDAAVRYVKPGGVFLYSTCTVSKAENEDNVRYILAKEGFASEDITPYLPDEIKSATAKDGYIQLLPGQVSCDGFFIARFKREK